MVAVPLKLVTKLHPDTSAGQFQRSRVFKEAIEELSNSWSSSFRITSNGMRRAHWKSHEEVISCYLYSVVENINSSQINTIEEPSESFVDVTEFREKAPFLEGSADYGVQL